VRYSVAPAFIASTAVATLPWAVSMMIGNESPLRAQRPQDLHAVFARHAVVEHHDVGLCSETAVSALLAVDGLATSKPSPDSAWPGPSACSSRRRR
jgi:hypothetical protein